MGRDILCLNCGRFICRYPSDSIQSYISEELDIGIMSYPKNQSGDYLHIARNDFIEFSRIINASAVKASPHYEMIHSVFEHCAEHFSDPDYEGELTFFGQH